MNDSTTNCPTTEQLQGLLDQSLPVGEQLVMQGHVDSCPECQSTLEKLVAGSESWDAAVGKLREDSHVANEAVLSEAVKRIKADEFVEAASHAKSSAKPLDFLSPSDQPGSIGRLGSYEVTEVIGQGGMGVVLKAFDPVLHRVVAVKVLAPYLAHNPQARKRFVREAQAIAAVSHDHVITIHAIDESADEPKIVMQFIAGRSLQDKLDASGSLELKEILRIGMQTAAGLGAAHAQGLVHRDVKPSNILLENGIQRVKLTDFGLARAVDDASLTQSGVIAGTPQYMAPEQANGDAVDYRADLFSLGSVLYAMCVGHSPFRASTTMGVLKRVCHDPPRPIQELNPDIPDWLCAIVMKLLAKSAADRFQSARQVADVLEKWLAHIQQPMVVPKPPSIQPMNTSNTPVPRSAARPAPKPGFFDAQFGETIFFQAISGRMLLTAFLLGAFGTMALTHRRNSDVEELLFHGFFGGLFVSFFGLLLISTVRFLGAHFEIFSRWWRGIDPNEAAPVTKGSSRKSIYPFGLSSENLAVMGAIVVVLLGVPPVFAAIVAIVVWRVLKSRENLERQALEASAASSTPLNAPSPESTPTFLTNGRQSPTEILRSFFRWIRNLFNLEATELNWAIEVLGWNLAGVLDIGFALMMINRVPSDLPALPMGGVAILCGLASFITALNIQARQNYGWVRTATFIGLLPISFGALIRIPLCVVTTIWLKHSDVKDSFSPLEWSQTVVGRFLNGTRVRLWRWFCTFGFMSLWTIGLGTLWLAILAFYLMPYGPATYYVVDQSARHLVAVDGSIRFGIEARGAGTRHGVGMCDSAFLCDRLTIHSEDNSRRLEVQLDSPVKLVTRNEARELMQSDLELFFQTTSGTPHTKEAASLMEAIQRLRPAQESVVPTDSRSLSALQKSQEQSGGFFDASMRRLPRWVAYTEVAALLDRSLFEVQLTTDRAVSVVCHPQTWLVAAMGLTIVVIWMGGIWWIYRRNRARNPSPMNADAAPTMNEPLAANDR